MSINSPIPGTSTSETTVSPDVAQPYPKAVLRIMKELRKRAKSAERARRREGERGHATERTNRNFPGESAKTGPLLRSQEIFINTCRILSPIDLLFMLDHLFSLVLLLYTESVDYFCRWLLGTGDLSPIWRDTAPSTLS
ncbi:hypothetical protein AVEN_80689-2 [Araneus ventricosus]|uniref:Uncharacterized protein n=1 Tax=Araneus ventricosus TaxID=182803 RepID=A0A4Y2LVJ6_ARAVE|nr:hypothetical protein AVEN_80689-2 [Araneus ventricosus]